jgi:hypothetical protein
MTIDVERQSVDVSVGVRQEIIILVHRKLLRRQLGKRVGKPDGRDTIGSGSGTV